MDLLFIRDGLIVNLERVSLLRFAFVQEIWRPGKGGAPAIVGASKPSADATAGPEPPVTPELIVKARIIGAAMTPQGRPLKPEAMHPSLGEYLIEGT